VIPGVYGTIPSCTDDDDGDVAAHRPNGENSNDSKSTVGCAALPSVANTACQRLSDMVVYDRESNGRGGEEE
jgi:hypothetical protein